MKAVTCAAALAATLTPGAVTVGQGPPQQPTPGFRLAVDVVPVDVSVVDTDGRPVTGLTSGDFTLDVDARTRRIVSAQYVSAVRETSPPAASQATFSSNAAAGGR